MPAHLIAEEGPFKGLVIDLQQGGEWIIGRDPDAADFVVDDSTVSRKHARLMKGAEGIYLKNLSRVNPTLVNEEKIEDSVLLKEGDRVQVGNTLFLFSEKEIPDTGRSPPKKEKKKKGYDNIFGDLEEPEAEPEATLPEKIEEIEEENPEPTAYDTIFEDSDEEEDLPFNLISETPLLLKVIAGPNAGAEIGIEKGRIYTIGKDPNSCDIVFQDLSVSRNHARLTVTADGIIHIEDLASKNGTVVNGVPITAMKDITPQDLVALGTTVFLIIDREAPQETIYSPALGHIEMNTKPSEEAAKEELLESPPLEEPAAEPGHWKREKIPTKHLITAASFAAIFLVVFMSFFSLFKSKGIEIKEKDPSDAIKEALAKFEGVQFSYNPGSGKLFLVGHVLTGVDYQEMRYRIGQIEFIMNTEDTVVIDEGVSRMMNDVLNDNPNWRSVSVRATQPGKFVATGYLQTNAEMGALSDYLTVNFPYLDRLENKVVAEENLNAELQSLLAAKGFGAVAIQLNNGDVVLTGRYSNKAQEEFDKIEKQIRLTNGIVNLKNFAIATTPEMAAIDVTQQYQVAGSSMFDGSGYSAILNGKIYTLGDAIDGMKITTIQKNTILLEKDGIKYKIDYTR